jgi:hypothetical protein
MNIGKLLNEEMSICENGAFAPNTFSNAAVPSKVCNERQKLVLTRLIATHNVSIANENFSTFPLNANIVIFARPSNPNPPVRRLFCPPRNQCTDVITRIKVEQ